MADKQQVTEHILQQGILPLYFYPEENVSMEVLRAIYRAGIRAVEYTNRGEAAYRNFRVLIALRNQEMPDMWLGVGTIKQLKEAEQYLSAGADFLVSPGYLADVARLANHRNLLYAPGCMTPTEIMAAEQQGLRLIKLFPGSLLGPEFVASIRDIFPGLWFMPTGGVDATRENLQHWFRAGVAAVGMGSKLISKKLMEQRDYATIESLTREVLHTIQNLKLQTS
jgi:2-dehydro-3-deoxyphosphogluconate aldolase/(4S)-4-hydroxy-2-oxoglutarate aldolase